MSFKKQLIFELFVRTAGDAGMISLPRLRGSGYVLSFGYHL